MEKLSIPDMSLDHIKMGLIRSGMTTLTPNDDDKMTDFLWGIVREIIKTAVENNQNLIIEGCYFPPDYEKDFSPDYLRRIHPFFLCMTEEYIRSEFEQIKGFSCAIENRLDDSWCTLESILKDNREYSGKFCGTGWHTITIDGEYNPQKYCEEIAAEVNL